MNEKILNKLLNLAEKAYKKKETPVSAIIICKDKIIAKAYNKRNKSNHTIAHAEILAIIKANKKIKSWRLNNCSMYVTIKPCDMCMNVIKESRISNVFYIVDRLEEKKQYNKTKFIQIESTDVKNKYLKKVKMFWKNKRKKI